MDKPSAPASRRRFLRGAAGTTAAACASLADGATPPGIGGFDHVALPMQNTNAMLAFYRALGLDVTEGASICSVYVGSQMINFHRPALWQGGKFTLRAPEARPPCGDLCFVWEGTAAALKAMLDRANAKVIEGPAPRQGGRRKASTSIYVRDPDGNLLEFMIYS
jgi:catechol 2,3-dioxygenase-like lactoylglutathione lyase family enzyme